MYGMCSQKQQNRAIIFWDHDVSLTYKHKSEVIAYTTIKKNKFKKFQKLLETA